MKLNTHHWKPDSRKIKRALGLQFRPFQNTLEATFQGMVDERVVTLK